MLAPFFEAGVPVLGLPSIPTGMLTWQGVRLQRKILFPGVPSPQRRGQAKQSPRVSYGTGFGSKAPAAPAGPPGKHLADYLFYLDLSLVNQLSDHAGHRHHPHQHHYQREKEADVVQESARK